MLTLPKKNIHSLIPDARTHALHRMCPKLHRCIAAHVRGIALELLQIYTHILHAPFCKYVNILHALHRTCPKLHFRRAAHVREIALQLPIYLYTSGGINYVF